MDSLWKLNGGGLLREDLLAKGVMVCGLYAVFLPHPCVNDWHKIVRFQQNSCFALNRTKREEYASDFECFKKLFQMRKPS